MSGAWGIDRWGLDRWGGVASAAGITVQNVTPPAGTTITDVTPVTFDVTALVGGLEILLWVEYPNFAEVELIYDTTGLTPLFRNSHSSITAIAGGFRFTFLRTPKWPDRKMGLHVYAADSSGQVINQLLSWFVEIPVIVQPQVTVQRGTVLERFGAGLALPFRFGPTGDFVRVAGPDLINTNVSQVLGTRRSELRWRPGFGATLDALRHRGNTRALDELARIQVERALGRWVPQVRVLGTVVDPISDSTPNQMQISTAYQIGNSQPEAAQTVI